MIVLMNYRGECSLLPADPPPQQGGVAVKGRDPLEDASFSYSTSDRVIPSQKM